MPESSIQALSATLDELTTLVDSFTQEQFNTVPFEGSWTAARVAQHLFLALRGVPKIMGGDVVATERAPDEKQAQLKSIFLNMDTKMKSPDFIFPEDKIYDKATMLDTLNDLKPKIMAVIKDKDLTLTVADFEFPNIGLFTGLEHVWFAVYHTQRHNNQLKNIREKIVN